MRPVRLSVTFQQTGSGFAARVIREDIPSAPGPEWGTYPQPMDAISFAAGTVMRELTQALEERTGGEAA